MDNQEEHENEIRPQSPSSSSSSPSSPSSSSSSSSSPSHTQSFASSPSTQKELSAPSSSGSSSSSSSPFSEPSSPVHATVDEASTSLAGETSHLATVDAAASRLNECMSLPGSFMREDECAVSSRPTRDAVVGETNHIENSIQSSSIRQDLLGELNANLNSLVIENPLDEQNVDDDSSGRFSLTEGQLRETNVHDDVFSISTVEQYDNSTAETNGHHEVDEHIGSGIHEIIECMSEKMCSDTTSDITDAISHMTLNSKGFKSENFPTTSAPEDGNHDKVILVDTIKNLTQKQTVQVMDHVNCVTNTSTSYKWTEVDMHITTENTKTTVSDRAEQCNTNKIDNSIHECQSTQTVSGFSLGAQHVGCKDVEEFPDVINNQKNKTEDDNNKMTGFIKADNTLCSSSIEDQNNLDIKKNENGSKMSMLSEAENDKCSTYTHDPSKQQSTIEENNNTMSGLINAENVIHSSSTHEVIEHSETTNKSNENILQNGCALETERNSQIEKVPVPVSESLGRISQNVKASNLQSLNNHTGVLSNELAETECNNADTSSDSNSLHRAQTMPMGDFEIVDGMVCQKKQKLLKRSSTDKWKGDKRNTSPKGLEKKKNKILKRICTIQKNGIVEFDVDKTFGLSELFQQDEPSDESQDGEGLKPSDAPPHLDIVMLIVGTRGDVQPFIAIGKRLQAYGHRVRLATHSNFEDFVSESGLEFFPLGGDPKVLAGYMVKNKGFLPSGPSEIRTQRKQLKSIINSLLPACMSPYKNQEPFKVQAIIANPPAYGHVHVAEYLKVPLHIFFTMPWTPTSEFAHPLSRVPLSAANKISYQVVDSLIWVGIRGLINDFRRRRLKLRPTYFGPHLSVTNLPTGYIWSPHLVPKPKDWGSKIDVVGFCFLNLSEDYVPPPSLVEWLAAGPPPIYVGFGSLPVEDPDGMTDIILKALIQTSQRGIIGKGWGGIGTKVNLPDTVYLVDNCPHDWLFPHCAAVVHHGGAGTTAAGLRAACPTTVVPFFGDQPFWGDRVHEKGVGPVPIPVDQFCLDKLIDAIRFMLDPEVKQRAIDLSKAIKEEDGVEGAFNAFHKHLPKEIPSKAAVDRPKMHSKACYGHWSCFFY